jgi:protein-L-isoaspartate(D-aspartate) O-methyltransferase
VGFEATNEESFAEHHEASTPFGPSDLELRHELELRREHLIRVIVERRGVADPRVIEAFRRVPRELFVPQRLVEMAYDDEALPIGMGQTISQPSLVAEMLAALQLRGHERVLEVGTGSGYVAALLAHLAHAVDTVERVVELARDASARLQNLGISTDLVRVHHHDGTLGFAPNAPYDAIVVAASGPRVPHALIDQLVDGGRLVMPVGDSPNTQRLLRVTRTDTRRWISEDLGGVRFVPLVGSDGWQDDPRERD